MIMSVLNIARIMNQAHYITRWHGTSLLLVLAIMYLLIFYLQNLQSMSSSSNSTNPQVNAIINKIVTFDNIPRKKKKFIVRTNHNLA